MGVARDAQPARSTSCAPAAHGSKPSFPADLPLDGALDDEILALLDAERVRDALATLPADQRGLIEMGFFGGGDASGDRPPHVDPAGDRQNAHSDRTSDAAQNVWGERVTR